MTGQYITFGNVSQPILVGFSLTHIIVITACLTVLYLIIFLYMLPLTVAVDEENPLEWYYPCVCGCLRKHKKEQVEEQNAIEEGANNDPETPLFIKQIIPMINDAPGDGPNVEANKLLTDDERSYIAKGVMESLTGNESSSRLVIEKLVKKYGDKTVVNNLSLTLFKNEILVLLGHNGAGKSTTINLLTGIGSPNSGTAQAIDVMGETIDMFSDYRNLVDFIGVCPQEDVLIDRLTVKENLKFFCKFKDTENAEQVINDTLDKYNLYEKRDTQAKSLSGG